MPLFSSRCDTTFCSRSATSETLRFEFRISLTVHQAGTLVQVDTSAYDSPSGVGYRSVSIEEVPAEQVDLYGRIEEFIAKVTNRSLPVLTLQSPGEVTLRVTIVPGDLPLFRPCGHHD